MRRYLEAYGFYLAGVLTVVAVAFFYYRRLLAGNVELAAELAGRSGPARRRDGPPRPAPPDTAAAEEVPASEDG